jgi:hypothetical protein
MKYNWILYPEVEEKFCVVFVIYVMLLSYLKNKTLNKKSKRKANICLKRII